MEVQRCVARLCGIGVRDESLLVHPLENHRAPLQRQVGVDQRRINRRCGGKAGNECSFGQLQLVGGLGEVDPGGIGNAIGAGAEIHVIQVLLKNLLLAQLSLELQGQGRFLQLAGDGAVLTEKDRSGQLLRDGAGSFANRPLTHVGDQSPGDSPTVDAIVVKEATVLRRNEGLLQQQGHGAGLEFVPRRWTQLLDDAAATGQQGDGPRTVEAGDATGIGERGIHHLCDGTHSKGRCNANARRCRREQGPAQAGAFHIPWVRGLWPTAKAVTSIPRTRNG